MKKEYNFIRIFDINIFMMVSDELNLGRAAARLGLSQPTVTRVIQKLERRFATNLFERHSNGIRLTYAGEEFQRSARLISQQICDLSLALTHINERHVGSLKIGFFTSLNSKYLIRTLTRLFAYPGIKISLMEASLHHQISALRQKQIDVALIPAPLTEFDLSLNSEYLWKEPLSVVLPDGHEFDIICDISWKTISNNRIILRIDDGDRWSATYIQMLAQKAGHRLNSVEVAVSRESVMALVRAGFGAGLMSKTSAASFNTENLSVMPLNGPFSEIQIIAAWLPENANPLVRLLLEEITQAAQADQAD